MRETGYYWVKYNESYKWMLLLYFKGVGWQYIDEFSEIHYIQNDVFFEINETRIKNPDEK